MRNEARFSKEGEIKLKSAQRQDILLELFCKSKEKAFKELGKCMTHSRYSINCDYNYIATKIVAIKMQRKLQMWEKLIMKIN